MSRIIFRPVSFGGFKAPDNASQARPQPARALEVVESVRSDPQQGLIKLVDFDNPRLTDIQRLPKVDGRVPDGSAQIWKYMALATDSPPLQLLAERVRGGILVNPGAGTNSLHAFAANLGVAVYVHSDLHLWVEQPVNPTRVVHHGEQSGAVRIDVRADMMDLAPRIRRGSVHWTLNDIDDLILSNPQMKALAREVAATTPPGGVVFGASVLNTGMIHLLESETGLFRVLWKATSGPGLILERTDAPCP